MNYIYKLDENNNICGEVKTALQFYTDPVYEIVEESEEVLISPAEYEEIESTDENGDTITTTGELITEAVYETIVTEKEVLVSESEEILGYYENFYETDWKQYDKCWISKDKLSYTYPDGTFTYTIVDEELVTNDYDPVPLLIEEYIEKITTYKNELLEIGYELSEECHIELNDTTIARFEAVWSSRESLTYPFDWICRETDTLYSITDADEFNNIKLQMVSYMSTVIRVASTTKTAIRNCTTQEEIETLYDDYIAQWE